MYTYMCMCVCMGIYICACAYVYMFVYTNIYIYIYIYVRVCIYICVCVCVYIYIYINVCVCIYIYIYIYIFTYPSTWTGCNTVLIFEFRIFFSKTNCHMKVEKPNLFQYLPLAGGRKIWFILFPKVLVQCKMQTMIWTWVSVSNFLWWSPLYDKYLRVYVYIYVGACVYTCI